MEWTSLPLSNNSTVYIPWPQNRRFCGNRTVSVGPWTVVHLLCSGGARTPTSLAGFQRVPRRGTEGGQSCAEDACGSFSETGDETIPTDRLAGVGGRSLRRGTRPADGDERPKTRRKKTHTPTRRHALDGNNTILTIVIITFYRLQNMFYSRCSFTRRSFAVAFSAVRRRAYVRYVR